MFLAAFHSLQWLLPWFQTSSLDSDFSSVVFGHFCCILSSFWLCLKKEFNPQIYAWWCPHVITLCHDFSPFPSQTLQFFSPLTIDPNEAILWFPHSYTRGDSPLNGTQRCHNRNVDSFHTLTPLHHRPVPKSPPPPSIPNTRDSFTSLSFSWNVLSLFLCP